MAEALPAKAWWRAGLVTAVLGVQLLAAAPAPAPVREGSLKRPEVAEEIGRWHDLLSSVGMGLSRPDFEAAVVTWTGRGYAAHRALLAPIEPLERWTGTGQGWALFASPDTHPGRLEVAIRENREWVTVYRRLDPEADELAAQLSYRRVRGAYDGLMGRRNPRWTRFTDWIASRVFEEHPEATALQVQLIRQHTTLPWEPDDPDEKVRYSRIVERP